MFEKIIVASEIMKGEKQIIKCLDEMRILGTRKVLLMQCLDRHEIYAQISSFVKQIYENMLNRQKKLLDELGFEAETRIVTGDMKQEILRIADQEDYALIVAAAAKRTVAGEFFFGGVAYDVIYRSNKPVLLVRIFQGPDGLPSLETSEGHMTDHILFPTDFSENASLAFDTVKEMVAAGIKKVTLAHIQDQTKIKPYLSDRLAEFNEKDTKRLNQIKGELKQIRDIEVDTKLIYGSPSAELIKMISEQKIPLVVMGNQGRGYIKDIFLGSVSSNIARHSSASVLLIPAPRK